MLQTLYFLMINILYILNINRVTVRRIGSIFNRNERHFKDFPLVKANDKVNLNVKKGEIHALVGENGAGKST